MSFIYWNSSSQWAQLPTKGFWHAADFKLLLVYKLLSLRFGVPSSILVGLAPWQHSTGPFQVLYLNFFLMWVGWRDMFKSYHGMRLESSQAQDLKSFVGWTVGTNRWTYPSYIAFSSAFLQPLLCFFAWRKGWLDGVSHQGLQLLHVQAICFTSLHIVLFQTVTRGERGRWKHVFAQAGEWIKYEICMPRVEEFTSPVYIPGWAVCTYRSWVGMTVLSLSPLR